MWESKPDDVVLPGLAFRTPEPDRTPDTVFDAIPEVDEAPSLCATGPAFLCDVFCESLGVVSRFPISLPRPDTSVKRI